MRLDATLFTFLENYVRIRGMPEYIRSDAGSRVGLSRSYRRRVSHWNKWLTGRVIFRRDQ